MLEMLQHTDREFFLLINGLHNSFFDFLMYWISNRFIWMVLYLWFLYLLVKKFPRKQAVLLIIMVALLITVSDQLTVFLKNWLQRPRPCHDAELAGLVHVVRDVCGGPYGFVSGHASNSFALAVFLIPLLNDRIPYFDVGILIWASAIAYSRVYLGVHYPGDVVAGALLGALLGFLFVRLFFFIISKIKFFRQ